MGEKGRIREMMQAGSVIAHSVGQTREKVMARYVAVVALM
jgi:hypothetical protein